MAIPIVLTGIAEPLINATDLALVGQKVDGGISAVGLGSAATLTIVWVFSALLNPISARIGFYYGRKEEDKIKALTQFVLVRLGIICSLFSLGLFFFSSEIIALYTPKQLSLAAMATDFLEVRLVGLPFLLGAFFFFQVFKGMQNTKIAFYITLVAGLVNLLGDYLLIDIYGVRGAAFASSFSHFCMFGMCFFTAWKKSLFVKSSTKLKDLGSLLTNSLNLMVRTILLNVTLFVGNKISAQQGDVALELHTILGNVFLVIAFFLDGVAGAGSAICSKLNGENNQRGIFTVGLKSVSVNVLVAIVFVGLGYLVYPSVFSVYTKNNEVVPMFEKTMLFYFLTILAGGIAFTMDGIFVGIERIAFLRNVLIGSTILYSLILLLSQQYTVEGVWLALFCWMLVRALFPFFWFVFRENE